MLGNANAIGIPFNGNNQFSPSSIKDANGNSLLKQQLLTKRQPTIGGTILDEKTNQGSARTIQQGRAYMFDGTDDYVATTLNLNTFCKDTFHIDLWIDPTDGQPSGDQAILGAMDNTLFGTQGTGSSNGITIALFTTGKLYWAYKANGNFARADSASAIFVNGAQPAPRKFRFSATAGVGLTISEWNGSAWVAIPLDPISNGLFSTNNVVMSSFNYSANLFFGNRNANGTPALYFGGELFGLEVMNSSLVDYIFYKCDEQAGIIAYDSSGNNRHGTITGATLSTFHNTQNTYSWQNEVGYSRAINFDGVDDNASVGTSSLFNIAGTDNIEFETNIRLTDVSIARTIITKRNPASPFQGWTFRIAAGTGRVTFFSSDGTNVSEWVGTTNVADGTFKKIKLSVISNVATITINDVPDALTVSTVAVTPYTNTANCTIGDWLIATPLDFLGDIAYLKFVKNGSTLFEYDMKDISGTLLPDISGNGNNATLSGSPAIPFIPRNEAIPTQDITGKTLQYTGQVPYNGKLKQANCLTFNGTSQYASIPDNAAFDISNNLSVSIRAKSRVSPVVGQDVFFCKYDSGANQREWYIEYTSSQNVVVNLSQNGTTGAGNFVQYTTTSPITVTNENTIGFTFASGTFKLYVNGVNVPTTISIGAPISTIYNGTSPVLIGAVTSSGTPANYFDGNLWDARIYKNTVLTDAEMLQIHNGTETTLGATPVAHYPMSAGAGTVLYDVIAGLDGTTINAPTWGKQDTYHYNMVKGFNRYMYFAGDTSDDCVRLGDSYNDVFAGDDKKFSFEADIIISGLTTAFSIISKLGDGTHSVNARQFAFRVQTTGRLDFIYFQDLLASNFRSVQGNTVLEVGKKYRVKVEYDGSLDTNNGLDRVKLYVNGVRETETINLTTGSVPTSIANGTAELTIGAAFANSIVSYEAFGVIYNVKLYNDSTSTNLIGSWLGYGNENSNWTDQVGSINGTVNGSPVNLLIPAKTSTTDVFNAPLRNPAGAYHNGSESVIDFRNSVNSPVAVINNWETAWAFNTARTNPEFKRTLTSGGLDHRADRFLGYNETLSGTNLTKVQNYTATKAI